MLEICSALRNTTWNSISNQIKSFIIVAAARIIFTRHINKTISRKRRTDSREAWETSSTITKTNLSPTEKRALLFPAHAPHADTNNLYGICVKLLCDRRGKSPQTQHRPGACQRNCCWFPSHTFHECWQIWQLQENDNGEREKQMLPPSPQSQTYVCQVFNQMWFSQINRVKL